MRLLLKNNQLEILRDDVIMSLGEVKSHLLSQVTEEVHDNLQSD
jgi:hypothetical protein